ncbi:CobW family GTP-binding protein [Streptomyces spiramenti]|uniref:Cobalamin biosynthesis protein CobW n=1 Tax=Streptomyces spiramenti TaxID=2720606 RepID=A0ABX1AT30_9ACTN|nr:GTP-binding protein [Streptomyces spiramenti]NJP67923.1 cobalamin biosynthesis protein CobW [Streptomyces spiramenti]
MLSVVIVAGMHGEARRATTEALLRAVPGAVALHHDLTGATGSTVTSSLRDAGGTTGAREVPLVNECACCALRDDLVPELERLAACGTHPLAVVELWDSVEPQSMAEVVAAHSSERVSLDGVVTAVDPALVLPCLANGDGLDECGLAAAPGDGRTVADTFARQLEYPSVLVVVAGPEAADDADHALLRQLHPTARQVRTDEPGFADAVRPGFDPEAAAGRRHPACALLPHDDHAHGVATTVWRARRPFHPGRLFAALEDLACVAVRSRGRFWLADRPDTLVSWECAGGALCVESTGPWLAALPDAAWELVPAERRAAAALDWDPEHGDRVQHLVFTAPELPCDDLVRVLDSCLLSDTEYAAGPDAWSGYRSEFDTFLAPAG